MLKLIRTSLTLLPTLIVCACQQHAAPPPQLKPTASIQELMASIVDPAADVVWESVGSTITVKGTEDRQPHSNEEWQKVRDSVVTLIEATNLLAMEGRRIVPAGGKLADEGLEGVLTSTEAQRHLDDQHPAFAQFASALRDVSEKILLAVDKKDAEGVMTLGTELDEVCEACHTTFWYPGAATAAR